MQDTVIDIPATARRALEILDRDGWNKGALTAPISYDLDGKRGVQGSHCLGGAWNIALNEERSHMSATVLSGFWGVDQWLIGDAWYSALAATIDSMFPGTMAVVEGSLVPGYRLPAQIALWNNHPDTTEDDVRAVLEKLAAG